MIENDAQWPELKDKLNRFMLRSNFSNEQAYHVLGLIIDYYVTNERELQIALEKLQEKEQI